MCLRKYWSTWNFYLYTEVEKVICTKKNKKYLLFLLDLPDCFRIFTSTIQHSHLTPCDGEPVKQTTQLKMLHSECGTRTNIYETNTFLKLEIIMMFSNSECQQVFFSLQCFLRLFDVGFWRGAPAAGAATPQCFAWHFISVCILNLRKTVSNRITDILSCTVIWIKLILRGVQDKISVL